MVETVPLRGTSLHDDVAARLRTLCTLCKGELSALQGAAVHEQVLPEASAALQLLCSAYLAHLASPASLAYLA